MILFLIYFFSSVFKLNASGILSELTQIENVH